MGPELKLGLNPRPSHEIAERRDSGYIRGIRGSVSPLSKMLRRAANRGPGTSLMRSRPGGRPPKIFYGNRGTPREVAHWRWRNELHDPLSSFVPELEPRRRRGFS